MHPNAGRIEDSANSSEAILGMVAASKLAQLLNEGGRRSTRRADKKRELAGHAIATLGQFGYARTSLRDIAERSGVSLGVLHYYFEDKIELIAFCVTMFKDKFIEGMRLAVETSPSPDVVVRQFTEGLVDAVRNEAPIHMLWYDINAQAQFDPSFRLVVREVEKALIDVVARMLSRVEAEKADAARVYMACDGIFRYHLMRHICGDADALDNMREALLALFRRIAAQPDSF